MTSVSYFCKAFHRGYLKGFSICLELRICIMPGFWIYILLWIYHDSNYASCSEYAGFLSILGFWICQGYTMEIIHGYTGPEYAWVFLNNSWICLNMPKWTWICLNLPEWICFAFRVILCLFERAVTYFKVCTKQEDIVWRNMRLWFEETKIDFLIKPGSICFVFCYKLGSFIRFQILLLPFGGHESWYTLTGFWSASNMHYILYYYFR